MHQKIWDKMLTRYKEGMNRRQAERLTRFIDNLHKDATVEGLKAYGESFDEINPSRMTSGLTVQKEKL